ncbi:hypothetical protein F4780DRAFT_771228 [Xylariomycetidae sp. FL0641]|nr:hypothetical protein F4780DRAFT_771228 [Xylariomycetidae sp. FL0641]
MASYSESDAVAKDFREALEDLQSNARYEIQNLTLIARENTEHALQISGALVEHIIRVAPHKKLPSLYVLDSIVKNVGTPYTLFLGRKLYQTFMDSYAMVDMPTRRKMDEMLKTWKEPIPGSIDTRPVFPPDVVRPIENALLKVRTATMQQERARGQQPFMGRGRPMPQGVPQGVPQGMPQTMPYRETPTPPGSRPPSHVHGFPAQAPMPMPNGGPYNPPPSGSYTPQPNLSLPARSTPQPSPALSAFQPPPVGGFGAAPAGVSVDALKDDIQGAITATQAQLAQTPLDSTLNTRLKALMDLQTLLQTQNLPQDHLVLIKNQIANMSVTMRAPPAQTSTPVPQPTPVAVAPPPAAAPKVSLDSLFGPGALAALMARNSVTPQASTPQPPPATAAIRSPTPQRVEPAKPVAPPTDPMALMNALRQAGVLPAATPAAGSTPASSTRPTMPLPFPLPTHPPRPATLDLMTSDIALKASSLKQFRPQLLPLLFEARGPQCTQCGRRFPKDEEGKKKKTIHMDWHFKVNQRIAEAEKRGQHRSWLVDEMDWINTREVIDKDYVTPSADSNSAQDGSAAKTPKLEYIPVPDDPVLANSVCPICQEKFETRWLDDAQEFVWPDATQVGERIYHASCHREATKDGGNTGSLYGRNTPEPVLGKRKAEEELTSLRGKLKMEAA